MNSIRVKADTHTLDTGAFDQHLAVVEDFLKWSLDSENRGGRCVLSLEQLTAERQRIEGVFRSLRVGARPSNRIEPLEEADIEAIRRTIGPRRGSGDHLSFPSVFSCHTQLRNWLMFEVALELGIRRGELFKLRLDSLPRAAEDGIRILRRPDDPHDSRSNEPAVKTAERVIPASRDRLRAVQMYLTSPSPLGRVSGKSPYVFVTRSGNPVSIDTADDIIAAIGRVYTIPARKLPRHHGASGFYYRTFEVEAYLLSQRAKRLWTVDRRDGTHQMLSETLLIAPRKFFHQGRLAQPLLVEPVLIQQISDFLPGRAGAKSAFERFDIRESDGSFCQMTSHQFRHRLNYIADKGGLPIDLQTRWMGRENPRDTDAYRHATVDERLQWVKEGIRGGSLRGPKADMYFELARTCRDSYLDGEVQAVHVTALGMCLHDFAVAPCPYHLNGVRGCSDYLRTKGNQNERQHLIQIQHTTERALSSAMAYSARGNEEIAEPWVRHCEETLAGVKKALAVDDATSPMDGSLVPASLGQLSRFKKLAD